MSDFIREITNCMYDFLLEFAVTFLLILRITLVIAVALLILLFALCLCFGWLEDWRVSLASIPLLSCAIVAFDRLMGDD